MKTLLKILMVQLCCFPLLITDAMARDGGDRKGSSSTNARPEKRPSTRPASTPKRNPITQSKPAKPSTRPANRPTTQPATRPTSKPQTPENRPANKPNIPNRPETKPNKRPNIPDRPETKPNKRPNIPDRPEPKPDKKPNRPENRPVTLPGNVKYPKPNRPTTLPGNANRPPNKRPGGNHQKPETKPGKNTRPIKKPNFDRHDKNTNITNVNIDKSKTVNTTKITNKKTNNWWDSGDRDKRSRNNNRKDGNNYYRGGDTNIKINNNFKNNANWSTNRKSWGYNPWWNRPATRPWYGGSWNCGWNNNYHHHHSYYRSYRPMVGYGYYDDDNDVAEAIGWGLVGWSLGKLIYDTGYQTYSNPYPAQPVPSAKGTQITYSQPITVVAAETAPADDDAGQMTDESESSVAESQEAFKQGNYLVALEASNKAVGIAPGDGALHEYRALILFALGKYSEAAGVLNPVLAGGPG